MISASSSVLAWFSGQKKYTFQVFSNRDSPISRGYLTIQRSYCIENQEPYPCRPSMALTSRIGDRCSKNQKPAIEEKNIEEERQKPVGRKRRALNPRHRLSA